MTSEQIQQFLQTGCFPGRKLPVELTETHISWVLLTPDFAFKIKKPVDFGFLDFSTFERRKHYCQEELRLNQRLAPEVYLAVLPISEEDGQLCIGAENPVQVLDYAIQMRRLDNRYEMDRLLLKNAVTAGDMAPLAVLLANFHQQHQLRDGAAYHAEDNEIDFADLFGIENILRDCLGEDHALKLQEMKAKIHDFLKVHGPRIAERVKEGFFVEGHGDLHTRNIFLLPEGPLVFDCLEFNKHFRQLDVLNELAFLCMDMEYYGRTDLSAAFWEAYCRQWQVAPNPEDLLLFEYFKAYRANVRLKVTLLQWTQHPQDAQLAAMAGKYWDLLMGYILNLGQ